MILQGQQDLFFIERSNVWCPLFGGSFKTCSTVYSQLHMQLQLAIFGQLFMLQYYNCGVHLLASWTCVTNELPFEGDTLVRLLLALVTVTVCHILIIMIFLFAGNIYVVVVVHILGSMTFPVITIAMIFLPKVR